MLTNETDLSVANTSRHLRVLKAANLVLARICLAYNAVFRKRGHTIDETEYYKYWTSLGLGPKGEIERHRLSIGPLAIRREKRPTSG